MNDLHRLSLECRVNVFVLRDIYIPQEFRTCEHHLNGRGLFHEPLIAGFNSINRPYVLRGNQIQMFFQGLRNAALNANKYEHEDNFSDEDFKCLSPTTKQQFRDLLTFCDPVPCQGGFRYVNRKDLLMFLCKMCQGVPDEFLKLMFDYSSRQSVNIAVATVRKSLMQRFVAQNIGLDAIIKQLYIDEHVTDFANELYNPEPAIPRVIAYIDGTYSNIDKSTNFRSVRQSYSAHKSRHLVKPALLVAPDAYILNIHGPYFSDSYNNYAA